MSAMRALAARPRRIPLVLGILALALVAGVLLWPQDSALGESAVSEEWVARHNGPASEYSYDYAWALAVDGWGNVYVTGESPASSTSSDYATIKYGPDGSQEWAARYDGPASLADGAYDLAVDGAGNVYVAGYSYSIDLLDYPQVSVHPDYATIKYGPDGSEQWMARYDGPVSGQDRARALAVDGSGNVYVTGDSLAAAWPDLDYATIKYGPDGSEQWVARYADSAGGRDRAEDLAVDGSGNVYVTGHSEGSSTRWDYATIKYGPDGSEEWVARYDGPAGLSDFAERLALDGAGNVYVSGASCSVADDGWCVEYDYATIKYGPDGSEEWVARYGGTAAQDDWAYGLAVDGSGNVYVTGYSYSLDTGRDYATIRYGPDGGEQWVARYDGPASGYDKANDLALDGAGNVYVTGGSQGDYATIKYGPDGSGQWVARYESHGGYACALALDGAGNVYVTGRSEGAGTDYDYATIKYGPAPKPTPTPTSTPCPPGGCPTPTNTPTATATLTPTPVGGSGFFPKVADPPSDQPSTVPGIAAAVAAGALALGGAAWWARRRRAG